ncbi:hypothetical protein AVEN_266300-1 [Araneus ventricosus]|uniref:Uncharacterized protein n=1 Tax=Araneus ventricosus TaxID=182803 RepID=A0A4Y2EF12_ARAVE|nr:hypothetical protein AVEN_266300-1 [Araneus ventricosus]
MLGASVLSTDNSQNMNATTVLQLCVGDLRQFSKGAGSSRYSPMSTWPRIRKRLQTVVGVVPNPNEHCRSVLSTDNLRINTVNATTVLPLCGGIFDSSPRARFIRSSSMSNGQEKERLQCWCRHQIRMNSGAVCPRTDNLPEY